MDFLSVRKGSSNSTFSEKNSSFIFIEIFFLALAVGITNGSWLAFGAVYIGSIIFIRISVISAIFCLLLSFIWGALGYEIASFIEIEHANLVIATLFFVISLGVHFSAFEWLDDL